MLDIFLDLGLPTRDRLRMSSWTWGITGSSMVSRNRLWKPMLWWWRFWIPLPRELLPLYLSPASSCEWTLTIKWGQVLSLAIATTSLFTGSAIRFSEGENLIFSFWSKGKSLFLAQFVFFFLFVIEGPCQDLHRRFTGGSSNEDKSYLLFANVCRVFHSAHLSVFFFKVAVSRQTFCGDFGLA